MAAHPLRFRLLALVSLSACFTPSLLGQTNPLATEDQQQLDALAIRINNQYSGNFAVSQLVAATAYDIAHGILVSPEAASRLNNAIAELTFSSIQKAVNADPYRPKVYWVDSAARFAWFGMDVPGGQYSYDNPDCIYRTIPISGSLQYEIHGQRFGSGPADVTFSLINDVNSQGTIAYLEGKDLIVNPDGSYVITIDNLPANGRPNHIQSTSAARQLFVRDNLGDWSSETPDRLSVDRVDNTVAPSAPGDLDIANAAIGNLIESTLDYGVGALGVKTMLNPLNTLSAPSQSSTLGTLATQASSFGHFQLTDQQALVVTVSLGGASYFVLPVTDPWMVSVDPVHYQSSLNNRQAVPDTDGRYTFVISLQDPGVYNWLSTAGLHEGTIMARWQGLNPASSSQQTPSVQVQLVNLNDLDGVLPAQTRFVTYDERVQQLATRLSGYMRRAGSN